MTIHDYILKHGLVEWKNHPPTNPTPLTPWTPDYLVSRKPNDFAMTDEIKIFTNTDHTHLVSMNITSKCFMVVHRDFVETKSEWLSSLRDYEPDKLQ
jgi:hypothetical protein